MAEKIEKKPEVMVTGAGGVLARHVIKRLKKNYDVIAVDFRWKVENRHAVKSYHLDMTKRSFEDIFRNHNISGLIHLGRVVTSIKRRKQRYNANVLGTKKLFDMCREYGVSQVIVLSSFFVYGAHPFNPALLNEDAPLKASDLTSNLVDSVELENLSNIYLWRYPKLQMTVLRPCNVAGPGVRNNIGRLLMLKRAPVLIGFSPVMQFVHVEDLANAIALAYEKNKPGIYNVAPNDWVAYKDALKRSGVMGIPLPSAPDVLPFMISRFLKWKALPSYLINYFKHPTIIDGTRFMEEFGWKPEYSLDDIFNYYKSLKEREKVRKEFAESML